MSFFFFFLVLLPHLVYVRWEITFALVSEEIALSSDFQSCYYAVCWHFDSQFFVVSFASLEGSSYFSGLITSMIILGWVFFYLLYWVLFWTLHLEIHVLWGNFKKFV